MAAFRPGADAFVGWLKKRGEGTSSAYRSRLVIVRSGGVLEYWAASFRNVQAESNVPEAVDAAGLVRKGFSKKGEFDLHAVFFIEDTREKTAKSPKQTLSLITAQRTYALMAGTAEQFDEFVRAAEPRCSEYLNSTISSITVKGEIESPGNTAGAAEHLFSLSVSLRNAPSGKFVARRSLKDLKYMHDSMVAAAGQQGSAAPAFPQDVAQEEDSDERKRKLNDYFKRLLTPNTMPVAVTKKLQAQLLETARATKESVTEYVGKMLSPRRTGMGECTAPWRSRA
jgi:hypothetical protein